MTVHDGTGKMHAVAMPGEHPFKLKELFAPKDVSELNPLSNAPDSNSCGNDVFACLN